MVCEGVERGGEVKDAKVEGEMTRLGIGIRERVYREVGGLGRES